MTHSEHAISTGGKKCETSAISVEHDSNTKESSVKLENECDEKCIQSGNESSEILRSETCILSSDVVDTDGIYLEIDSDENVNVTKDLNSTASKYVVTNVNGGLKPLERTTNVLKMSENSSARPNNLNGDIKRDICDLKDEKKVEMSNDWSPEIPFRDVSFNI